MTGRGELSPLSDRLALMQILRIAIVATVLLAAASSPDVVGLDLARVAPITAAYALVTVAAEVGRRLAGTRGLAIVTIALLIDGVYLALLTAPSGGPRSPLAFLLFVHIVGVTLLASYRSGLKLALWHSLLMVVGYQAVESGWTELLFHLPDGRAVTVPEAGQVMLAAAGCLLLAGVTAACARLSEQELRQGKAELAALVAMGTELEQARRPEA